VFSAIWTSSFEKATFSSFTCFFTGVQFFEEGRNEKKNHRNTKSKHTKEFCCPPIA
jgi:hypothetical protein